MCFNTSKIYAFVLSLVLVVILGIREAMLLPFLALVRGRDVLRRDWRLGTATVVVYLTVTYIDMYMGLSTCPPDINPVNAIVFAPIGEEAAFRGVIQGYLREYSRLGALTATSVIFGLLHEDFVLGTVYGLILGLAFESFGLVGSIVVHAANNALWTALCA